MKEYDTELDRTEKKKAYEEAFSKFKPLEMFNCAILMPSVTCLDIDMLKSHFWSETKLICVENFSYIHCSEREWKETVLSHLPSKMDKGNVYFHNGSLEDLQLGAVLKMLGEESVDFAFFDLCGELTMKQYRWIWNNRSLFKQFSPILYTIDLQPSIINDCKGFDKRMKCDDSYGCVFDYYVNENDKLSNRTKQSLLCWSFVLNNILNNSSGYCTSIVYRSGQNKHKMMLTATTNYAIRLDDYRHDYYEGFFKNSSNIDESLVKYDGINWGEYGTSKYRKSDYEIRSNDILLFQNKEVKESRFDKKKFLDYFFSKKDRRKPANKRRFRKDRILNCVSSCSFSNFPPEVYDRRYKSTRLYFAKCEQIYNKCVLDKTFDYNGISIKFDKNYDILFCNSNGEYVKYIDHFDEALELYRQKNGSECGDVVTKTLK